MADWAAFVWVAVGVLLSSVLPFAVTALWPAEAAVRAAGRMTTQELFVRIWPGVRMVLAALVIGAVVLVGARAAGVAISTWWEAVLIGLAADRSVSIVNQVVRRRFTL